MVGKIGPGSGVEGITKNFNQEVKVTGKKPAGKTFVHQLQQTGNTGEKKVVQMTRKDVDIWSMAGEITKTPLSPQELERRIIQGAHNIELAHGGKRPDFTL